MPSTLTSVLRTRVANQYVEPFRQQAQRFGLTPSAALEALIADAVMAEQQGAAQAEDPPEERPS